MVNGQTTPERRPRRVGVLTITILAFVFMAGCSGASKTGPQEPHVTNSLINAWLSSGYTQANCWLLRRPQIELLPHPTPWVVGTVWGEDCEIFPAITIPVPPGGDYMGLPGYYGVTQMAFIVLYQPPTPRRFFSDSFPEKAFATERIPGSSWSIAYQAWPNRKPTAREMTQLVSDIIHNLSTPPPQGAPSDTVPWCDPVNTPGCAQDEPSKR